VRQLLRQLTHLLALLLWVAAALALLAGMPALSVAIVVVIALNAAFAFAQEYRADRSAERLHALLPTRVRVHRDGQLVTVDAEDLVRGDLVEVGAGDRLAADLELRVAHGVAVDESLVTGESVPVRHRPGERVLAGTFVVEGEGTAAVVATGAGTTVAGIAELTRQAHRPPSPLTVQLNAVVRVVAVIAVVTGTVLGASALVLGLSATEAFLFGVGVAVALVPEGLLPTVTLSLARGAQLMAERSALVRRLDAVETLGATTFVCTDKTGTLTQNRMAVVEVWTRHGTVVFEPDGYRPVATRHGTPDAVAAAAEAADGAARCVTGRVAEHDDGWAAVGDPMEAALHCWALGLDRPPVGGHVQLRRPFTSERLRSCVVVDGVAHVLGAPESVLDRCPEPPADASAVLHDMTARGRRVVAVARGTWHPGRPEESAEAVLTLEALVGLEDPPRPDVAEALEACRRAAIRVLMVTGDHPATAAAVATEVGLLRPGGVVVTGAELPGDDDRLGELLDRPDGVVVARVAPADKLRIARALRGRGHRVAMTGDGVNDAPALREADVGVAMGATGSDVAREASDLVLLDDHFATIVTAVELGRATFTNVRRFLTYHLADNVAELAPFAAWALTGGQLPLAIGVLQVLALDIGTDLLPAAALGAEPPSRRVMDGPGHRGRLVDGGLLRRAFGVLGAVEAAVTLAAFTTVLLLGGWRWGTTPDAALLATASGSAFAVIAVAQMANAFACRSATVPVRRLRLTGNRFVLAAVAAELALLVVFLGVPFVSRLLGGSWPSSVGWAMAGLAVVLLLLSDAGHKALRARARARRTAASTLQVSAVHDRAAPPVLPPPVEVTKVKSPRPWPPAGRSSRDTVVAPAPPHPRRSRRPGPGPGRDDGSVR
jgi:magnesium-transporting ATPase (P-type)